MGLNEISKSCLSKEYFDFCTQNISTSSSSDSSDTHVPLNEYINANLHPLARNKFIDLIKIAKQAGKDSIEMYGWTVTNVYLGITPYIHI